LYTDSNSNNNNNGGGGDEDGENEHENDDENNNKHKDDEENVQILWTLIFLLISRKMRETLKISFHLRLFAMELPCCTADI
jgi:hypothetical protein